MNRSEIDSLVTWLTETTKIEYRVRTSMNAPRWVGRGLISWLMIKGTKGLDRLGLPLDEAEFVRQCMMSTIHNKLGVKLGPSDVQVILRKADEWYLGRYESVKKSKERVG